MAYRDGDPLDPQLPDLRQTVMTLVTTTPPFVMRKVLRLLSIDPALDLFDALESVYAQPNLAVFSSLFNHVVGPKLFLSLKQPDEPLIAGQAHTVQTFLKDFRAGSATREAAACILDGTRVTDVHEGHVQMLVADASMAQLLKDGMQTAVLRQLASTFCPSEISQDLLTEARRRELPALVHVLDLFLRQPRFTATPPAFREPRP